MTRPDAPNNPRPGRHFADDSPTIIMAPVPPSFGSTFTMDGAAPSEYLEIATAETQFIPRITAPIKEDSPERIGVRRSAPAGQPSRPAQQQPYQQHPHPLQPSQQQPPQPNTTDVGSKTAKTSGVVRAGSLMAIAAVASRLTGFLVKVALVGVLATGLISDAYSLANTLPNIVFELLIGGVLTSVAIPLLARAQRSDPDGGLAYTQRLMTLAAVGLLAATVLAVAAAPLLTKLYMDSDSGTDPALTTKLAYLLLPQMFFYGMAALFGAILNTKERFIAPAWAPVANNVLVLGVLVALVFLPGGINLFDDATGSYGGLTTAQYLLLGLGTTAGIVLQAVILLPSLRKSGFRFKWRFGWDKRMSEAGGLAGWAVLYVVVSQAGYVVTVNITSNVSGGYTIFSLAALLFQMPYGILGVSILTAIMPRMSRHAAAGELALVKDDMSLANRLSAVALLPVSAAIMAIAGAVGVITFSYGRNDIDDAILIGTTCAGMAIGLLPLAMSLVQMRVFYAMKDGRTPVIINAIMVAVRVPLLYVAVSLDPEFLLPGLALATAVSYIVGAIVGELWLRARFGPMGTKRVLVTIGKMTIASGLGGLAAWALVHQVWGGVPDTLGEAFMQLIAGGVTGVVVVFVLALLLRVEEFAPVTRKLLRLVGRGSRNPVDPGSVTLSAPSGSVAPAVHNPPVTPGFPAPGYQHVRQQVPGQNPVRKQVITTVSGDGTTTGAPDASQTSPTLAVTPQPPAAPQRQPGQSGGATPEPSAALTPGSMVGGRYRLVNLIAVDASGHRFWRAKDTVLPRDMAITLLPDGPNTSATVARTLRAGRLHHIGLPQTLDLGTERGQSYVVGQWVDGATLTDLLAGGPLEGEVASSITAKVADAIAEAHRNGISLGAIHPSLVRVNFDGQVRLSHVIAHAGATPDQDIRAIGGLLYLMLTGTWPLSQAGMSPPLPPAPTSGGREVPASDVRTEAPAALAALAERTLHPDGPHGVRSPGAIASLLHGSTPGEQGVAQEDAAAAGPAISPLELAERKLRKERRIKLSVAGLMLVALTVLLAIVIGSVVKQAVDDVQDPVAVDAPLSAPASNTEIPTTANEPSPATDAAAPSSEVSVEPPPVETTAETVAAPVPIPIIGGQVYDPQGDGDKDNVSRVDRVWDGDPNTFWLTLTYKQNFAPPPNGFKDGVGLMLELETAVSPSQVIVQAPAGFGGIKVAIIASDGNIDMPYDQEQVLATSDVGEQPAAINLTGAPVSKFIIVKIIGAIPDGNQFSGRISEIQVLAPPAG